MVSNILRPRSTFAIVVALLLSAIAAQAQTPERLLSKLDAGLSASVRARESGTKQVIIRATSNGLPGLTNELRASGLSVLGVLSSINGLTARVPVAALEGLSGNPFVESISTDAVVVANQASSGSTLRGTLALPLQAPAGNRIGVAVIDSGLEAGAEFGDRIAGFYDFTQNGQPMAPSDGYGHGTHVAGLIAGSGDLSGTGKPYRGVAPKARIIALKVLNQNGAGNTSDVIKAIEFAIANKDRLDIDIINLSLGHPIYEPAASDPLVQAVEAAVRAGIVVVTAAGNYGVSAATGQTGYAGIQSPGNAPSAITVGSAKTFDTNMRSDDRVANYSSRGPSWYDGSVKPDLIAPGHGLVAAAAKSSALYLNNPALRVDDSYLRLSGTSMAAAVVSGTAALVLEANPALTPNAVKAILQFTALPARDDQGVEYDPLTQGTGSVNAAGAIDVAAHIDAAMPVSSWWLTTNLNPWTVIDGQTVSWSENIIWNDALSFGPVVYVNQPYWAENIVWGSDDNIVWGSNDNIVWGSNIVWGNNIVWASDDNIVWGSNIVWGNTLIGSSYGKSVTWGMVVDNPSLTVWGSLKGFGGLTGAVLTSP
jgi:serine protease AprX